MKTIPLVLAGLTVVGLSLHGEEIPSETIVVTDSTYYYANGYPENTLKGLESGTNREEQFCSNIKTGWVEYCFNETVTLTNLNIWNYNAASYLGYGMSNIQIEVSSDWGQSYSLVTNLQTMTTVFTLPKGTGTTNNPFTSIPLQHLATHLRIRALTTHSTANYSGLSTVRFYGVKPNAIVKVMNITVSAYSSFNAGRPPGMMEPRTLVLISMLGCPQGVKPTRGLYSILEKPGYSAILSYGIMPNRPP